MATARNQPSLTWSELLNISGGKLRTCVVCGDEANETDVLHCGACRAATYYSRRCQKADWSHHKPRCSVVSDSVHFRHHERFTEYYAEVYMDTDTSAEYWVTQEVTTRSPKCALEDLSPALRIEVVSHKKRFAL